MHYHAMRMRWCRTALLAFIRRWAVYFLAASAIFVAGMAGGPAAALQALQSATAWLVLPLFLAATHQALIAPATAGQAIFGGLLVLAMLPLLWPKRWASAERALPLTRRETLRSDCIVVPLALLPWVLPCVVGAHALIASDPPWLHESRGRAAGAFVVALVGSGAMGVALLQWLRRRSPRPPRLPAATPTLHHASPFGVPSRIGWVRSLLVWPLWRGPAQRTGRFLAWGSAALCLVATGVARWPGGGGWWLAAYATASLAAVTRLNALSSADYEPLWDAVAPLPLSVSPLKRARVGLALAPLAPSGLLLIAALSPLATRLPVLLGFVAVCVGSCLIEALATPADAAAKAGRWCFSLVVCLAFASEVLP